MINAAKEFGRTAGYNPQYTETKHIEAANHIVSGRYVKLAADELAATKIVVKPILGGETAADVRLRNDLG